MVLFWRWAWWVTTARSPSHADRYCETLTFSILSATWRSACSAWQCTSSSTALLWVISVTFHTEFLIRSCRWSVEICFIILVIMWCGYVFLLVVILHPLVSRVVFILSLPRILHSLNLLSLTFLESRIFQSHWVTWLRQAKFYWSLVSLSYLIYRTCACCWSVKIQNFNWDYFILSSKALSCTAILLNLAHSVSSAVISVQSETPFCTPSF